MKIYQLHDSSYKLDYATLGNKAANLVNMARLGLPIPQGFVIATSVWQQFEQNNHALPEQVWQETQKVIQSLRYQNSSFGKNTQPLLVSVRSGSAYSMPGMMDSILNIGVNDQNVTSLAKQIGDWAAYDSYRRLIQMFGATVYDIHEGIFVETIDVFLKKRNIKSYQELTVKQLQELITINKHIIESKNSVFPQDPFEQLKLAIEAVFKSWSKPGAVAFREYHGIPHDVGTAVVIQQMIFGNAQGLSGTGVYFTRNPKTGANQPFGEILSKAQGEDVVGGYHHPRPFTDFEHLFNQDLLHQLTETGQKLEKHFHKPQDMEFTIQNGTLWILQTRTAKLTGKAAFKIARDMIDDQLISLYEAIRLIQPGHIIDITKGKFDASKEDLRSSQLATGIPASSGVASGILTLSPTKLRELSQKDQPGILVMDHIDPNDVDTLIKSQGVITTKGGSASHMAIIMRALNLPGIVGTSQIEINYSQKTITVDGTTIKEGALISFDGSTGDIFNKSFPIKKSRRLSSDEQTIISLREKHLGKSAWSAACYKVRQQFNRRKMIEKINEFVTTHHWRSTKARVISLLNYIFPASEMISSQVLKPNDNNNIKKALEKVIKLGYENAPRTTHFPEKLAGAPWAYGPNQTDQIDQFMCGDWPGKYRGLAEWKKDPELEAIVVSQEPPGKMDQELAAEHFTFTVSMMEGIVPKVIVSINIGSPHLRQFERAAAEDLIIISTTINSDSRHNLGATQLKIGKTHLQSNITEKIFKNEQPAYQKIRKILSPYLTQTRSDQQYISDLVLVLLQKGEIPLRLFGYIIKKDSLEVINEIQDKVFHQWWEPPVVLPHLMCALEDTIGTSVLEGQGRISHEKIQWCLIYGVKGSEEKEKVLQLKTKE